MINKLTLTFLFILALTTAACTSETGTPSPSKTPSLPPEATPEPPLPPPFPQTQTINGLEVELLNARILDGQLTIDICHQMPTQEDWIVGPDAEDAYVTIGEARHNLTGFGILYYRTSDNTGEKTHRCDALTFDVANPDPDKILLTLNEFYTSVPEVPDCEVAQQKLDEAGEGITFICEAGPGYFGYTITKKTEGMSEDDARMIVFDSFSSHAEGPWVFEIDLPAPLTVTTSTPWPTPAGIEPMKGQVASASGADMLVTGNLVDGSLFLADVCYVPPSYEHAWALAQSPDDITIDIAGQVYPVDFITYTGWENNYGFPHIAERYRCHRLNFTVPAEADTSLVLLSIDTLYAFPPESGCDKADTAFDAGQITNAACSDPLQKLAGPWVIQTGLGR